MHTQDIAAYQHPHLFHYSGTRAERKTMRVVLLTVVMMIVEIVAGWAFHSMALLADGWHMSTHAAALGLSWLAFVFARRHAVDQRFVFGTWKIEVLGGFVSGILLGVVGLAMAVVSVERLTQPVAIRFNEAIYVAVAGLAVNLVSVLLLGERGHPHEHGHGQDAHAGARAGANLNLRAAYLHVVADALTSVLAIAALLGGKFFNWCWLDPAMGIVGAILILRWTVSLLRETGGILLDREADGALVKAVRAALEIDRDTRVSDLHLWPVGPGRFACLVSLVAARPRCLDEYKARLKHLDELAHVTVEIQACAVTGAEASHAEPA
jgi:cation diffusion facilitator family transporter